MFAYFQINLISILFSSLSWLLATPIKLLYYLFYTVRILTAGIYHRLYGKSTVSLLLYLTILYSCLIQIRVLKSAGEVTVASLVRMCMLRELCWHLIRILSNLRDLGRECSDLLANKILRVRIVSTLLQCKSILLAIEAFLISLQAFAALMAVYASIIHATILVWC